MLFSFKLPANFLEKYRDRKINWGFVDAGGNAIGELTFIRTYSRIKEDGTKETWIDACERIINGMYSIQKDWCKERRLPWNDRKAQASAQEAFERLFEFKWTPPGRGIAQMGTPLIMEHRNSASLLNCAVVSTIEVDRIDPGKPFAWFMEALMYGIGTSGDTAVVQKDIKINERSGDVVDFVVPDTKEGWGEAVQILVNSYLKPNGHKVVFDYSEVRPYGSELKTFGGKASGPEPLRRILNKIDDLFYEKIGQTLDSRLVVDIFNLIGTAVVAGSTRRSAELMSGSPDDQDFINLKNPAVFPERNSYDSENPGWGWASNNSLSVTVGTDYSRFTERIINNGEPGFLWLDVAHNYGRLIDAPRRDDNKTVLTNPCGEQFLESYEMCTLSEIHMNRAESKQDFERTLKFAYLYAKTVCLVPTGWPETNAVMQRNNRIGLSVTGIAGWLDDHSLTEYRDWADSGYHCVCNWDEEYSRWLCIRESIRKTTSKPGGTVPLLSGATPGACYPPGGQYYLRAIRFGAWDDAVEQFRLAGYRVEKDVVSENTYVVFFPVMGSCSRSEKDVSIFEKINLAAEVQKYWSDNAVSVTVSFDKETEAKYLETVLNMYEGQLKSVSFLPMGNETYPQQPYTQITKEEYEDWQSKLLPIDTSVLYGTKKDAEIERFCDSAACAI